MDDGQIRAVHRQRLHGRPRDRELRRLRRLVGRHLQLALDNPDLQLRDPRGGRHAWFDTMVIPQRRRATSPTRPMWMNYVYDPENAARIAAYIGYISPVAGRAGGARRQRRRPRGAGREPADVPRRGDPRASSHVFADLDEDDEAAFDERFAEIIGA